MNSFQAQNSAKGLPELAEGAQVELGRLDCDLRRLQDEIRSLKEHLSSSIEAARGALLSAIEQKDTAVLSEIDKLFRSADQSLGKALGQVESQGARLEELNTVLNNMLHVYRMVSQDLAQEFKALEDTAAVSLDDSVSRTE